MKFPLKSKVNRIQIRDKYVLETHPSGITEIYRTQIERTSKSGIKRGAAVKNCVEHRTRSGTITYG